MDAKAARLFKLMVLFSFWHLHVLAQEDTTTVYQYQNKDAMYKSLVTHNHDDAVPLEGKTKKQKKAEQEANREDHPLTKIMKEHNIRKGWDYAPYEYTLSPEKTKEYEKHNIVDLGVHRSNVPLMDMLTHSMKDEKRYIFKGDKDSLKLDNDIMAALVSAEREMHNQNNFNNELVVEVSKPNPKFNEILVITTDGKYRYKDGRELVGTRRRLDELAKGKPITEATFYYKMRRAGLIEAKISLKKFRAMSPENQASMLNSRLEASVK